MTADTLPPAVLEELQALAGYMRTHGLVLATAESCTAGMISAMLADVPGAGALLDCAFVTYSVDAKRRCLGVDDAVLAQHNLTSEAVARAMAEGAARRTDANVVIANTGVADDRDARIPAGTQCFAWAFKGSRGRAPKIYSETRRFSGDRAAVRQTSAEHALGRIPHYGGLALAAGIAITDSFPGED